MPKESTGKFMVLSAMDGQLFADWCVVRDQAVAKLLAIDHGAEPSEQGTQMSRTLFDQQRWAAMGTL